MTRFSCYLGFWVLYLGRLCPYSDCPRHNTRRLPKMGRPTQDDRLVISCMTKRSDDDQGARDTQPSDTPISIVAPISMHKAKVSWVTVVRMATSAARNVMQSVVHHETKGMRARVMRDPPGCDRGKYISHIGSIPRSPSRCQVHSA